MEGLENTVKKTDRLTGFMRLNGEYFQTANVVEYTQKIIEGDNRAYTVLELLPNKDAEDNCISALSIAQDINEYLMHNSFSGNGGPILNVEFVKITPLIASNIEAASEAYKNAGFEEMTVAGLNEETTKHIKNEYHIDIIYQDKVSIVKPKN